MTAGSSGYRGDFPTAVPSTARVAQSLSLPGCQRRGVLDAEGVDLRKLGRLLTGDRGHQSPFLIRRTQQFERRVLSNGMADVIDLARSRLGLGLSEVAQSVVDAASIRDSVPGFSPTQIANQRAERTASYLSEMLSRPSDAVNLLQKPLTRLRLGAREVLIEQDLMVCAAANETVHLVDIESFAEVDGFLSPDQVGQTMAACAVAVISLRQMATAMDASPLRISARMLLITPSQTGFKPVGRVLDLSHHIARLEALIANLSSHDEPDDFLASLPPLPAMPSEAGTPEWEEAVRRAWQAVSPLAAHLTEACMACPMFKACRREAQTTQSITVLGTAATQEAAGVSSITRAIELAQGATPGTDSEHSVAASLTRARLATEAAAGVAAAGGETGASLHGTEDRGLAGEGGAVS